MKKYLLVIAAMLLSSMNTFAQTRDSHGIISEQPAGELRAYFRSGGATYANIYFRGEETQDGIATEVVFSEDGTKVYIKNIISHAATNTWVEGTIDGETITVPLGQVVYWFSDDNYGMSLARIKVNGGIEQYTVDLQGSIKFTIDGKNLLLEDTSADPGNNIFDGIGLVYTDAGEYDKEWSYYLDYETVLTYAEVSPITPPADLETELYSMEYEGSGHIVRVGFDNDDVYIQGISETRLPNAWTKGTIQGTQVIFPMSYAGFYSSYLLFFCGADAEWARGDNGYYDWQYAWSDGTTFYDYDAGSRSFSTKQTVFASNSNTGIGLGETYHSPRFRPYSEHAGTPADPSVSYYQNMGAFTILMLDIPLEDTEGRFIDPAKVSYCLYVDDDEPYTLYTDEYKYLTEDLEEVPYLFSDETREAFSRSYIYEKGYALYIFQTGFDRIGVQTIYRGGGEEHRSNIGYYYINGQDGIEQATVGKGQAGHFDLQGRPVAKGYKGLTISRLADGRVVKHLTR